MSIYENIEEIVKEHGLSIREVALKAGIGETSIYRWKTIAPSTTSLRKVAKALHVSVEDLTSDKNEAEETPEYRAIQRKAKRLNPEQQERLLKMMDLTFEEVYGKNSKDD